MSTLVAAMFMLMGTISSSIVNGMVFNTPGMSSEAGYHQAVTRVIATVLIPKIPNAELRFALEGAPTLLLQRRGPIRMVQSGKSKPVQKAHTILIKGSQFIPNRLEVSLGDTVVWKNEDIVPHTATAEEGFDSKKLGEGQSWSFKARQTGSFPYICRYHPAMQGELIVK